MRKITLLFLLVFSSVNFLFAQYVNVTIDGNSHSPNEPSICINPKNTNILVAGANITNAYYSTNGGLSWTWQNIVSSSWGVWGDPIVVCDTNNVFYFFHLAKNPVLPWPAIDRIVCQKSTNNGVNWINPGTYAFYTNGKLQDKEGVLIDPYNNYIYVANTQFDSYISPPPTDSSRIFIAKSTDGGNSWTSVNRIDKTGGDCIDGDNTVEGAVPCVGANHEVYVAWNGPKIRNSQFGIFFNKSTDFGNTWLSQPTYICDQPGGWDYMIAGLQRSNGLLATACDLSNSPYRGNIYINWTDSVSPNNHDVKFIKSTNGGTNWSTVKKVNTDNTTKEQFLSWMTVDRTTGYIWIVFYDRRNDASSNNSTDVYLARSTDGGDTFIDFKISSSSFIPVAGVFIGDYNSITASHNKVRPMWTRLQGSQLSVMTAIVDSVVTSESNIAATIPDEYKLEQNFPNPFNPSTNIRYQIPENGFPKKTFGNANVVLKIYNILGREVETLVNEKQSAGTYEVTFNASKCSSGIYFYKLETGNFVDTKRMVLIK
jgi:hypothetical protein